MIALDQMCTCVQGAALSAADLNHLVPYRVCFSIRRVRQVVCKNEWVALERTTTLRLFQARSPIIRRYYILSL